MANTFNGNTIYIDSTGDIADTLNLNVLYIVLSATAANAQLILQDQTTNDKKLRLDEANSKISSQFDFSRAPLVFPNGLNINTITNCVATLIVRRSGINL